MNHLNKLTATPSAMTFPRRLGALTIKPIKLTQSIIKHKRGRLAKNGEYEVETIWNSAVYTKKSELSYLLGLYYLVS